jgi:hypothetical protein
VFGFIKLKLFIRPLVLLIVCFLHYNTLVLSQTSPIVNEKPTSGSHVKKEQSALLNSNKSDYIYQWHEANETSQELQMTLVRSGTSMSVSADDQTICEGGDVTITWQFNRGSPNPGTAQYRIGGGSWNNLGTTSPVSTVYSPGSTTTYYGRIVSPNGGPTYSDDVTVTVVSDPVITDQPSGSIICPGGSHTMDVSASGGTGSYIYQWQYFNGSSWVNISGATEDEYEASPSSETTYRCHVTTNSSGCEVYSNDATVSIGNDSDPPSGASANPSTICPGDNSTLTVTGGSLGTGASWVWYEGSCGGTYVTTGATPSVSPGSTTTYYVRAEGNCNTTSCVSVTITVVTESTEPTSVDAVVNP